MKTPKTAEHPADSAMSHPMDEPVVNTPSMHGFVILGREHLFLCHLTMFAMENHCYQLVLRVDFPPKIHAMIRERPHGKTYFLSNDPLDQWTLPELKIRRRREFLADIWDGIPEPGENGKYKGFPWRDNDYNPIGDRIESNVPVSIVDVVYYRHFDFGFSAPRELTYFLFGEGNEAHMTNYQTAEISDQGYPHIEPDFDHVATLAHAPAWLPQAQLQAGVHISINGNHTRPPRCQNPLPLDEKIEVEYQGRPDKHYPITVKESLWCSTRVVLFDGGGHLKIKPRWVDCDS